MEKSAGRITFTYVSKVIIWTIVIGLILSIILAVASTSMIEDVNDFTLDDGMSFVKTLLIGLVVVEVLTVFLSCKLATSKIKKKYEFTDSNRAGVIKNITIFLIIWAILIALLNLGIKSALDMAFEEANEDAEYAERYSDYVTDKEEEELDTAMEILDFVNTMTVVLVIVDVAVVLLMIPLERKWLADKKEENETKKEESQE